MLSVSNQIPRKNHTVNFSTEVEAKEDLRAIRNDKKKMDTLILQCYVAFDCDKPFALKLFQEAVSIADKRSFTDEDTKLKLLSQEKVFKLYGYSV